MISVKIENGIIVARVCGSYVPEGFEQDTQGSSYVGAKRAMFTDSWTVKPLYQLVKENVVEVPEGQKLSTDGLYFEDMSEEEKIKAGVVKPTELEKVVDGKIVRKSSKELYDEGLISADEYNAYITSARQSAYATETDRIFWDYQEGKATKEDWLSAKAEIRNRLKKVGE